ncbi:MAG: hypothetical protein H0U95_08950 [Bacteroidetes bacterium]|nr:hypothetical protein [Bacteroidota bacterium]
MLDFLINLEDDKDDDDETSSRSKHKLLKNTISFNHKLNAFYQSGPLNKLCVFFGMQANRKSFYNSFRFSKTTMSIAICCLKI